METKHAAGGLDRRVLQNIRFNARRLAREGIVRGMEIEDYEQDLTFDLLRRARWFDRDKASFPTFADRVIAHRSLTLAKPSVRKTEERSMLSLDAPAIGEGGDETTLIELIALDGRPIDETFATRIDVRRFVKHLDGSLVEGCRVLLAGNVSQGAREVGIHRSTAHERVRQVRAEAIRSGLGVYLSARSDSSASAPVCGEKGGALPMAANTESIAMLDHTPRRRPTLLVTEADLVRWLAGAETSDALEYYRGFLAIDRIIPGSRLPKKDARELDRVAKAALEAADAGRAHLVQRRHGDSDYSYFIVARGRPGLRASPLAAPEARR